MSSRNSYLSDEELSLAVTLYEALNEGGRVWEAGLGCDQAVKRAKELVKRKQEQAETAQVKLKLDYLEMNDPETFEVLDGKYGGHRAIFSGALWVGRTRLIDNILLGDHSKILC